MFFFRRKKRRCRRDRVRKDLHHSSHLAIEKLESRDLLAIIWANEFVTSGPDDPNFDTCLTNEPIARQIVNRAIDDWESVIRDFRYDSDGDPATNNTFNLTVIAEPIAGRGSTGVTFTNGKPTSATVRMDDNGQGTGWFFDQTPLDDAEFTAIANSGSPGTGASFHASFVDVAGGFADF